MASPAWELWSATYDDTPNALLALETRILSPRLGPLPGRRILDAGSGTGRWMSHAESHGAQVIGIDASREMLLKAEDKPRLRGRSALGDIRCLPLLDDAFDTAICSFTLAYVPSVDTVLRELARVARRVMVSDLHPAAVRAGWSRSFRAGNQVHELAHQNHSIAALDDAARYAGLVKEWRIEASFDEQEREIFVRAGKEAAFERTCLVPAVLITSWRR